MIQIDNAVPMPSKAQFDVVYADGTVLDFKIENVPMPKEARAAKMDKSTAKIVDRYIAAHSKVYGIGCVVKYEKPWLRVQGVDGRFSKHRLLEMARQLEYRIGE